MFVLLQIPIFCRTSTNNNEQKCTKAFDRPEDRLSYADAKARCSSEVRRLKYMGQPVAEGTNQTMADMSYVGHESLVSGIELL